MTECRTLKRGYKIKTVLSARVRAILHIGNHSRIYYIPECYQQRGLLMV